MISFTINSIVQKDFKFTFSHFNKNLFLFLAPSTLKLLQFDGSNKGDIVHIQFSFPKGEWISEITDFQETDEYILFIDEGKKLPFGLVKWKHKHYIKKLDDQKCEIIDDVCFSAKNKFLEYILFLPLYLPLLDRKRLYNKYFNSL